MRRATLRTERRQAYLALLEEERKTLVDPRVPIEQSFFVAYDQTLLVATPPVVDALREVWAANRDVRQTHDADDPELLREAHRRRDTARRNLMDAMRDELTAGIPA